MHDPAVVPTRRVDEGGGAGDVDGAGHRRIELARLEGAVADRVEDAAEAVLVEEPTHADRVLGVERHDAGAGETKRLMRTSADHLAGMARVEMAESMQAGDAGDAGDEKRESQRHPGIL